MQTLGTINVVGTLIPVVLATKEEAGAENIDENGFAAYGWETATIALRVWPDKVRHASARFGDLSHETVHAIMMENGGSHVIQRWCPHLTSEQCDQFEEQLVRAIAPGIVTSIDDLIELRAALVDLEEAGQ